MISPGEERGLIFIFACLLSLCHLGLFSLYAITAKGWHSLTGSRTQQVHPSLDVHIHAHGLPGFTAYYTAPRGVNLSTAQVSIRVDSCHQLKRKRKKRRKAAEDFSPSAPVPRLEEYATFGFFWETASRHSSFSAPLGTTVASRGFLDDFTHFHRGRGARAARTWKSGYYFFVGLSLLVLMRQYAEAFGRIPLGV